jgi:DNA-binding NarL/FixJ family response regulator
VLLTAAIDENEVLEAVRLGMHSVVLKEMASQLIVQCIRKVHSGEQWLEKRSVGRAVEMLLERDAGLREIGDLLTARELELVRLVASGRRNKLIADKLSISEGTVKVPSTTSTRSSAWTAGWRSRSWPSARGSCEHAAYPGHRGRFFAA